MLILILTFKLLMLIKSPLHLDSKVDAGFLIFIHIILQLCLPKLVEGHDDQGNEDVDEEEGKHDEKDNVEDGLLGPVPGDRTFILVGRGHGVLQDSKD